MPLLPFKSPNEPLLKLNVRMSASAIERLKQIANQTGYSLSDVVRTFVDAGITTHEAESKTKSKK